MQFDYRAASLFMFRMFVRFAWRTSQRRWTTVGVAAAERVSIYLVGDQHKGVYVLIFAGQILRQIGFVESSTSHSNLRLT